MRTPSVAMRLSLALGLTAATIVGGVLSSASGAPAIYAGPTPGLACDKASLPEKMQGRAPIEDVATGRAAKGYSCNATEISHTDRSGGYRVERYVDKAGHECGYYDSTLLWPTSVPDQGTGGPGVYVLDMKDPAHPARTAVLQSPAMQSPHESVRLNQKRGLLVADMGYPTANPGFVDVWDVTADCRHPVLKSSTPMGILGHESGFSPDGRTLWISTTAQPGVTAIDVTNEKVPSILWHNTDYTFHGMNINSTGTRLYGADLGNSGLTILDVSQIQKRVANPQVKLVSHITWPNVSIPQNTIPVTIKGHKYLVEFDEYSRNVGSYDPNSPVGAARMINIDDEQRPRVVSQMRLAVNEPKARAGDQKNDPGAQYGVQGYAAHYCAVPRQDNPQIVACSFILSGLRIFNIADPMHPREVAYFNKPAPNTLPLKSGSFAMSAPSFDIAHHEVWYADGDSGFYAVQLTDGVWPHGL
jgi:hypothetical protein